MERIVDQAEDRGAGLVADTVIVAACPTPTGCGVTVTANTVDGAGCPTITFTGLDVPVTPSVSVARAVTA